MTSTLAIPNYNGYPYLQKLIPQVIKEDFDQIYVLDDCSTDQSAEYLSNFPQVKFIKGSKNLGPTANRNRILKEAIGDIIVFLDVDMELDSNNITHTLDKLINRYPDTAVFGGLILDHDQPMQYNYGPFPSLWGDIKLNIWYILSQSFWDNLLTSPLYQWAKKRSGSYYQPVEKEVDWVTEGIFIVRADIFRQLKGFDEEFVMFYEGPDYCKRVRNAGYKVCFTPRIKVKHLGYKSVNTFRKNINFLVSALKWYKKHSRFSAVRT